MTNKIHCSREYRKGVGTIIPDLLLATLTGILENDEVFNDPPFNEAESKEVNKEYADAKSAYNRGGIAQEPAWHFAVNNAIALLDKEADYVDDIADGDVNIINLSGFTPTDFSSGRKNKHIPGQPKRISFEKNIPTARINTWCEAHEENDSYGCLLSEGAPLPEGFWIGSNGIFKTTPEMPVIYHSVGLQRKKLFTGLKTGVSYWVYFYVTNTAGVGPISNGVSISCG